MQEKPSKRTGQQNRGLHKGCELIAKALNDAGNDMRAVLKPDIEIPWTTQSVKDHLFRPIMKLMYSKQSTTDLEKTGGEIEEIWETIMRHLMQRELLDEYIPFPSMEQTDNYIANNEPINKASPWRRKTTN